ncbi:MAG: DUF2460 domain-containing protein [Hyphomonadaceae bacterium]|nr:DUF2460 domain-containing protein [Hyphomonadaceae bacterium]
MSFHEVLLPLPLALGANGGPERRTEIVTLGSGREARNSPWAQGRRRFDIGGAVRSLDELHALVSFFEARRGRLHGFRFRDFLDWKSCAPSETPSALDQVCEMIGTSGAVVQLQKTYGAVARTIHKPVSGTVLVAVDGDELSAEAFIVDVTTGRVTLDVAAPGATVTAGFLFDTPVRFDSDRLDISLDAFGAGRPLSVPLIEITP